MPRMFLNRLRAPLRLALTGAFMGAADLVPGVSGGTVAFVAGIYEELLFAVETVTGAVPRLLLKGAFMPALRRVPWLFLLPLSGGMATSVFGLAHAVAWVLATYPTALRGAFFGLVSASVVLVSRRVRSWRPKNFAAFAAAALSAFVLCGLVPMETPSGAFPMFLSGVVAISAMILPGISGSFILLLLGKYGQVLQAAVDRDIGTLAVFAAGCLCGVAVFSRAVRWMFAKSHDGTLVVLSGVMLGSLRRVWPWIAEFPDGSIAFGAPSVGAEGLVAMGLAALGFAAVLAMGRFQVLAEHTGDVSPSFAAEHGAALAGDGD